MRPSLDDWTRVNRAAALSAIGAVSILVWHVVVTVILDPLPRPLAGERTYSTPTIQGVPVLGDGALILRTVARNPLRSDRRRAAGRYRPPGAQPDVEPEVPMPPPPQLNVVGVALGSRHRQLVALTIGQTDSRLLSVGDTVHGFAVTMIKSDQVSLARSDTVLVLPVPDPFREAITP